MWESKEQIIKKKKCVHVFTHPYDLQVYFCLYAPIYMKYKGESGMCAGAQKMHMDISIGAYAHKTDLSCVL